MIKKLLNYKYLISIIIIMTIIIIIIIFANLKLFQKSELTEKTEQITKEVSILRLNDNLKKNDNIKISGTVKAGYKVDVISLGDGIVTNINFKVGNNVFYGQILANLYDNSVKKSQESLKNAQIALKTSEDNYNNNISLRSKTDFNIQENAIIAFNSSINVISNALNEIDYIINIENENQLPGIEKTLSVLNSQALINAKNNYSIAKNKLNTLLNFTVSENNILYDIESAIEGLNLIKKAIDSTISVLNNTIPSYDLSQTVLSAQKSSFSILRSSVIVANQTALNNLQNLENLNTSRQKDIDVLKNALYSAKSQVQLAQIAYDDLLSDLTIKAPVSGQITQKYIELGTKISPVQKIAEISQTNFVKIEMNLSSDDIYKIKLGQSALLDNELSGTISHIDPVADSLSKKVKVEMSFDNKNKSLIPETFVNVIIPIEQKKIIENNIILIPLKALNMTQNENFVFILKQDKAKKILVEIGKPKNDLIEILSGLNIGDDLIIEGNKNIKDGESVNIK